MITNRKNRFDVLQMLSENRLIPSDVRQYKSDVLLTQFHSKVTLFLEQSNTFERKPMLSVHEQTLCDNKRMLVEDNLHQCCLKVKQLMKKSIQVDNKPMLGAHRLNRFVHQQHLFVNKQTRNEKRLTQCVYKPAFRQNKIKN